MKSPNARYIPAVDHVRAIAAILVILHHVHLHIGGRLFFGHAQNYWTVAVTPFDAMIVDGHTGVALFMVLSGFIFTFIAIGKRIDYVPFLANRVLRIYPLMIFLFALGWLVYPKDVGIAEILGTLFIPFALKAPVEFWHIADLHPFTKLFWTIVPEFKFYLIFPALLWAAMRWGVKALLMIGVSVAVIRVALVLDGTDAQELSYYTLFGRLDQFLLGMAAAFYVKSGRGTGQWHLAPLGFGAMLLLLFAYNRAGSWPDNGSWKVFWPTIEGLGWTVFIIGYLDFARFLPVWLDRTLAHVGKVSFSLYLIHTAVISAVLQFGPPEWGISPGWDAFITAWLIVIPLTTAISTVTFRLVEQPFLSLRVRYLVDGEPKLNDENPSRSPLTQSKKMVREA